MDRASQQLYWLGSQSIDSQFSTVVRSKASVDSRFPKYQHRSVKWNYPRVEAHVWYAFIDVL